LTNQHELLDAAIRKVGNRYLATMLVAKRIRQLQHGAPTYVTRNEGESHFTVAMREIAEGLVFLDPPRTLDGFELAAPETPPADLTETAETPSEEPEIVAESS